MLSPTAAWKSKGDFIILKSSSAESNLVPAVLSCESPERDKWAGLEMLTGALWLPVASQHFHQCGPLTQTWQVGPAPDSPQMLAH